MVNEPPVGSVGAVTATVRDHPSASRFEVFEGDSLAGYAEYVLADGQLTLTHTVVEDDFEGRGLASELATAALTQARDRGLAVLPRCDFVTEHIQRHPEWLDLVPEGRRAEFGLPRA